MIVHRFNRLKIKSKIILPFVVMFSLFIMIMVAIFIQYFYTNTLKEEVDNARVELSLLSHQLDYFHQIMESCQNDLTLNLIELYLPFENVAISNVNMLKLHNDAYYTLYRSLSLHHTIDHFAFLDKYGTLITSNPRWRIDQDTVQTIQKELLQKSIGTKSQFFAVGKNASLDKSLASTLYMVKRVISTADGTILGYLFTSFNTQSFMNIFPKSADHVYSLRSDAGDVLLTQDPQNAFSTKASHQLHQSLPLYNATLTVDLSFYGTANELLFSIALILVFGLILLVISFLLINAVARLITKPILSLTKMATQIQDENYPTNFANYPMDEVGMLAKTFEKMVHKIQAQIASITEKQKAITTHQLNILNEQINPHFLYNSLASIHILAEMGNAQKASEMAKALSDFYRTCLSDGNSVIPLFEEVKNIVAYMDIQSMRYRDIVDFELQIDEEILSIQTLKLSLQPIVENAIYHGIKQRGRGKITIHGYRDGDCAVLQVIDNGVGMSKEKLQQVRTFNKDTCYGLFNVDERLRLYFGERYGLRIESTQDVGTQVFLTLPIQ